MISKILTILILTIFFSINNENSIQYEQDYQLLSQFFEDISSSKKLKIYDYRYYFNDVENESLMTFAGLYCMQNSDVDTCDQYIERTRYFVDDNLIEWVFNNIKEKIRNYNLLKQMKYYKNNERGYWYSVVLQNEKGIPLELIVVLYNNVIDPNDLMNNINPLEKIKYTEIQLATEFVYNRSIGDVFNKGGESLPFSND